MDFSFVFGSVKDVPGAAEPGWADGLERIVCVTVMSRGEGRSDRAREFGEGGFGEPSAGEVPVKEPKLGNVSHYQ